MRLRIEEQTWAWVVFDDMKKLASFEARADVFGTEHLLWKNTGVFDVTN